MIGAMLGKCEMYSITLELTVGMSEDMGIYKRMSKKVDGLPTYHFSQLKQYVMGMQSLLEDGKSGEFWGFKDPEKEVQVRKIA